MKSESEVAQSCPTLSDPMDCSLAGSSIHGIFQARLLEYSWNAIAFSDRPANLSDVINQYFGLLKIKAIAGNTVIKTDTDNLGIILKQSKLFTM